MAYYILIPQLMEHKINETVASIEKEIERCEELGRPETKIERMRMLITALMRYKELEKESREEAREIYRDMIIKLIAYAKEHYLHIYH